MLPRASLEVGVLDVFQERQGSCQSFPGGASSKEPGLPVQETQERRAHSLGGEDPLQEGMATHPSILAWSIPWTEEPGGL